MKLIENLNELKNGDKVIYAEDFCEPRILSFVGMNPDKGKKHHGYFTYDYGENENIIDIYYSPDQFSSKIYLYGSDSDLWELRKKFCKELNIMVLKNREMDKSIPEDVVYDGDEEPDNTEQEDC